MLDPYSGNANPTWRSIAPVGLNDLSIEFGHDSDLGREPINLPVGLFAKVRYGRLATKFRIPAKCRDRHRQIWNASWTSKRWGLTKTVAHAVGFPFGRLVT